MVETTTLRKCIGSARFGIEPHEAPVEDFPRQPSQKDGLGRMCREHWNQYTAGLARDAKARKAGAEATAEVSASSEPPAPEAVASADEPTKIAEPKPARSRKRRAESEPAAEAAPTAE